MSAAPPDSLVAALAGRYALDREIGRGGMARVYLARDLRHDRRVAIKVLSAEMGAMLGADRFLAEIKVTANLQHPNLLPLFDSGEAAGQLYYVMPFVEGGTLRARLDRETQLPVEEAVRITTGVANALAWAHDRGVIHRDLKPANILLHDGEPLVADFGIALAVSRAGGERLTQTGVNLGTPQYMSPEQATGDREIDARSDQYSLAATAYEMLAGEPPHTGATAQAVLARVLTEEHRSIRASRPAVPAHVERALDRALQKLPVDRFATIRDFAAALKGDGSSYVPRARRAPWPRVVVAATITAVFALAFIGLWFGMRARLADEPMTRTPLAFEGDAKFVPRGGVAVALNADGSQLVYNGGTDAARLYLKRRGDAAPVRLQGGDNAFSPVFTPDEQWIAFVSNSQLKKVPVSGGIPILVADSAGRFSWGDGDVIVISRPPPGEGLVRARPDGGPVETIVGPDTSRGEKFYSWPHVLPGGKAVLFNISLGSAPDSFEVAAVRLADRQVVRFGLHCLNPRYVSAGYLLCARTNGTVIAAPFDPSALRVTGAAEQVIDNVEVRGQGASTYAVSRNGTLVFFAKETVRQLVSVDGAGRATILLPDQPTVEGPRVSPDGKRVAFGSYRSQNVPDVFVFDLDSRLLTQLTHDGRSAFPNWSPDGRRLLWFSRGERGGIHWQPWDGSEPESSLVDRAYGTTISRRGNYLLTSAALDSNRRGLITVALDSRRRRPFGRPSDVNELITVSPDGRWLAVQADLDGRPEIFVEPIPVTGARHQVSLGGGAQPAWAPQGSRLYYSARGSLWAATLATAPAFKVVRRDSLFALNLPPGSTVTNYDLMPDGKSFVAARVVGTDAPPVLVTGWFAELRRRMSRTSR